MWTDREEGLQPGPRREQDEDRSASDGQEPYIWDGDDHLQVTFSLVQGYTFS